MPTLTGTSRKLAIKLIAIRCSLSFMHSKVVLHWVNSGKTTSILSSSHPNSFSNAPPMKVPFTPPHFVVSKFFSSARSKTLLSLVPMKTLPKLSIKSLVNTLCFVVKTSLFLAYMGLVHDYYGVEIEHSSDFVFISAGKYTDQVLKTHSRDTSSLHEATSDHKVIPFSAGVVPSLYKEQGPLEDTKEHADLANTQSFSYQLLLSELMYRVSYVFFIFFSILVLLRLLPG